MITGAECVTIEDASDKMFLRETVAEGKFDGKKVSVTKPVGGSSFLFEMEGEPRKQWLVTIDAEAIFDAMAKEES